ncbi:MAG: tetratricopeptide repeat protein [Bryobacteraceae bacterium]
MRARLLLLAAALVAYGASLGSGFHFDDYAIFSGPLLQPPRAWLAPGVLTKLSFWLSYQAGGGAALCHAFNLALHLGAVLLLYECVRRLEGERAAMLAAAIFAVHPLQAEAVNYVSARGSLLAATLLLAAFASWLRSREKNGSQAARPISAISSLLLCVAFLGAMLLANDQWTLHAPEVHAARYWLAQGVVAWRYLRLLVAPWGFTVDPGVREPAAGLALAAWALLLLAAAALWRWRAKSPAIRWALAGLILMVASALATARDLAADYRMYVPMIGFCAAAGILLERVKSRAAAVGVVLLLTAAGAARTLVWLSDERLWREAVRRAPDKVRPKVQLAHAVRAAEALDLLSQARELDPHDPDVPAAIGNVLLDERLPDAALTEFTRALALDPLNAVNLNNRGVALAEIGQTEAARLDFERALAIAPDLVEARQNLSKLPAR